MRRLLVISLLLLSSVAHAQKIRYNCVGCTLSIDEKRKIEAVARFESAYFTEVFGPKKLSTLFICLCGDRKSYKKKNPPPDSDGFYSPKNKSLTVFHSAGFLNTCFHECTHALFDAYAKNRPLWINEGLATYFEQAKVDSLSAVTIVAPQYLKVEMKSYVARKSFAIAPLMTYSHNRFHRLHETRNYTTSWGIVYFLITKHRTDFDLILYRISSGIESAKAIEDEYTGGMAQLERDIVEFYQ